MAIRLQYFFETCETDAIFRELALEQNARRAIGCEAEAGRQFCSDECESNERDEGATDCHCGHDDCRASHESHRDST
jgi:hypothetical protein